ncbi:MAG: serine/threonine-protein kinase, partial [Geminicoccaceae bacterium]
MIGRRIGHCDVLSRLGEGGMGQVFAGIDRSLDRPVAIKALRPELSRDPAFAARFRAEAGALARLSHPNVAHIYSLEQSGSQQFMILELVRGLTLQDLLTRHGPLDEMGALALAAQAVAGLAAAHAQGIVHRDLKPANLMVTADGMLKLMDFGIARVGGAERLTRHGHMIGTLAFMAPEQIRGASGDARSDLYSLGLVLYEMLAGRSPFAATTDYEFLDAQVNQVPAPLRDFVPTLSDRFHDAIMRCLAKAPEHRFTSAEAFGREAGTQTLAATAQEILRERIGAVVAPPAAPALSTKLAPHPMQAAPRRAPTVLVPL